MKVSILAVVVAVLVTGTMAGWTNQLKSCAVMNSNPLIYIMYTVKTSTIDVGVYGASGGWVIISPFDVGDTGKWHTSSSKHDMWIGMASGSKYTGCSSGCILDASIGGSGSCKGVSMVTDTNNFVNTSLLTATGGVIKFEFSRLLSTGDSSDVTITSSSSHKVVWGYRDSAATSTFGVHDDYGSVTVAFGTSRWDSGCPSKPCYLSKPSGASWGTCSGTVDSGSSCAFSCASGSTATSGTCSSGSWTTTPSCTSTATYCTLASSAFTATGVADKGTCSSSVASGSTCKLSCSSGYTAVTGTCTSATWTTTPSCTANPCTLTKDANAADMGTCSTSVASGKSCSFNCNTGYTATSGTCLAGSWSTTPACTSSGACTLSSTLPTGASNFGTCSTSVSNGGSCAYTCLSGYSAVTGKCSSGSWTTSPSCSAKTCSATTSGTGIAGAGDCTSSVASGSSCTLQCETGYTATTGKCSLGSWTTTPSCSKTATTCSLSLPTGATAFGTCAASTASGTTCSVTCGTGYTASSGTCTDGVWATEPSCTEKSCSLTLPSSASGYGTCAATVAGGTTCELECPSDSTSTTGVCSKGSWTTTPSCSTTCTQNKTCGSQTCGSIFNGCTTESCGTCQATDICDGTKCVTVDSASEWQQVKPDNYLSLNWDTANSNTLYLKNFTLPSVERWVAYIGKQTSWFSKSSTTISVTVVATEGVVGFGMRLQSLSVSKKTGYILWRFTLKGNNKASVQFCLGSSDGSKCQTASESVTFSTSSSNKIAITYKTNDEKVNCYASINGKSVKSGGFQVKASAVKNTGNVFVVSKGSATKTFSSLGVTSKTSVSVTMASQCLTPTQASSLLSATLNLDNTTNESAVSTTGESSSLCATTRRTAEPLFTAFEATIPDDLVTGTPSSVLSGVLSEAALSGTAVPLNGIAVSSVVASVPILEAATVVEVSSGLSVAAIAGIAAGSAVAGIALVGGSTVAIVKMVKREPETAAESTPKKGAMRATMDKFLGRGGGVDVMNNPPATHSSITNRSAPVEL